jgi:thiol:disulfide interchange protein DsbD
MAAALVALGLAGLGAWSLDFSRWRKAGGGGTGGKGYGARLAAAFGAGAGAALLAGACVAPGLAAVLALSAERHAAGMPGAWALPVAMGLGLAAPWPVLAAGLAKAPKAGRWTGWLGKALGAVILAIGIGYGVRAARATWGGGEAAAGEGSGVATVDLGAFGDAGSIQAAAEAASGDGPALWEFTADWCGTCRQMERGTLAQLEREGAFAGMRRVRLKANEPGKGGAREFLKEEGVRGFPVFSLREVKREK